MADKVEEDLKELSGVALWAAYTDLKAEKEKADKELELLRAVHQNARGVMRYSGVNQKRCNDYFDQLRMSVYDVNDYQQSCE